MVCISKEVVKVCFSVILVYENCVTCHFAVRLVQYEGHQKCLQNLLLRNFLLFGGSSMARRRWRVRPTGGAASPEEFALRAICQSMLCCAGGGFIPRTPSAQSRARVILLNIS